MTADISPDFIPADIPAPISLDDHRGPTGLACADEHPFIPGALSASSVPTTSRKTTMAETEHELSSAKRTRYPDGKGVWQVSCSCGYRTSPYSYPGHAERAASAHRHGKLRMTGWARAAERDRDAPDPARDLLAQVIEIVNKYQGSNAEQAMTEIQDALLGPPLSTWLTKTGEQP